jgi:DNA-binding transcriptional regulator YhcF (GntR family)
MIGANREAVTRAFAALQERGCVEQKNRRVYVRNHDALLRKVGYSPAFRECDTEEVRSISLI